MIGLASVKMPFCLCVFMIEGLVCAKCKFKRAHLSFLPFNSSVAHRRYSCRQVPNISFLRGKDVTGLYYVQNATFGVNLYTLWFNHLISISFSSIVVIKRILVKKSIFRVI